MSLFVKATNVDASTLAAQLRDLVRAFDVNQPVFSLQTYASFYRHEATGPNC
jgi:hypothetical protein